jgi:hypothetical protein
MLKLVSGTLRGLATGALLGLAVGAGMALFHVNGRRLGLFGFAFTPSISGLLIGSAAGSLIGLAVRWTRGAGKK